MQTAGDLISSSAEFTAGMQDSQNDLNRRNTHFRVNIDRNTAAVVYDGNRIILMDSDVNLTAVACHRLVNTVINYFIN